MLPNFLVVGAQKGGTTSLWEYLRHHPQIAMAPVKEVHFFDRHWDRGVEWYERQFPVADSVPVIGEATPAYARFPQVLHVAERAAATLPDVRIVYVLRNPIERIRSHYMHDASHGFENLPFERAVLEHSKYVDASRYAMQIGQWLEHVSRGQLCLILSEDLRERRAPTMAKVYEFLGVDATWTPPPVDYHTSEQTRTRRPAVRRVQSSALVKPLLRRIPSRAKQAAKTRLTLVANHAVAGTAAVVGAELAAVLRSLLRDDVEALLPYMPPDFDGWGIAGRR